MTLDRGALYQQAAELVDSIRSTMFVDPFIKIEIDIGSYKEPVTVETDNSSAYSWVIRIDQKSIRDEYDITYSVVEGVLRILMVGLSGPDYERNGVIAKITKAFTDIICSENNNEE